MSAKIKPKCGLCGKNKKVTKTDCCNNWICDDEHKYVLFSYARNSCHRNHRRYTLCAYHFNEKHKDNVWQNCETCKTDFDTPTYVYYGTNEYNFEALKNPEKISISCSNCGFTADTIGAFPLHTIKGTSQNYYCPKEECQKAGFQPTLQV